MPHSPTVSVIIPTYNRVHTLKRAVDSVLIQKDADWELIVVDDGSTDSTVELLNQYQKDSRIKIISQPNRGVSTARNNGVKVSQGKYIAFLDSDDEWLRNKLKEQISFFENSDFLIQQTREIWIRRGKRVNPPSAMLKQEGNIFKISLERCMITPSSVCMHRDLFDSFKGFDQDFPACEDYELWLRISSRHPVGLIRKNLLTRYGGHDDQLSSLYPALDRYRIKAIVKLLDSRILEEEQKHSAILELRKKVGIYLNGCEKRNKSEDIEWCRKLQEQYHLKNR